MQIIRGFSQVSVNSADCIATIGNFDGVHLGHQALFKRLRRLRAETGLPIVVILFEPHPREFLAAATAPPRLCSLRDKARLLANEGVDKLLCLRFNQALASMHADAFIEALAKQLCARHIVVGSDFRFGYQRQGDYALLQASAKRYGYHVAQATLVDDNNAKISSTRIRNCLREGKLSDATRLLGRPYQISGRVLRGARRGREWGFPTINLRWPFRQHTLHGIYAVDVLGLGEAPVNGAASVGCRPTVAGKDWNIEVHLLDYDDDCYGQQVTVQFYQWFRQEICFTTIEALKQQIACDVADVRAYFAQAQQRTQTKEGVMA